MPAVVVLDRCHCLAVRQAARRVTQLYDQKLTAAGLHATQFSILAQLQRIGPMAINALAREMVMDRTSLGRTIRPLQRQGLIAVTNGRSDRRRRELRLTEAGSSRLGAAMAGWAAAQCRFESEVGGERAAELRELLRSVAASELVAPAAASEQGRLS